jgi:hypothetical protein
MSTGEAQTLAILTLPRYEPCAVVGTPLAIWHDRQEDRYVTRCPVCRKLIVFATLDDLYCTMVWGDLQCCAGCQARFVFEHNPDAIGAFLCLWYSTGSFPQSASWVEAIPSSQCTMWANEIVAGLEAATAVGM